MSPFDWCCGESIGFSIFGIIVSFSSVVILLCFERRKSEPSITLNVPTLNNDSKPKVEKTVRMSLYCPASTATELETERRHYFRRRKPGMLEESGTQRSNESVNLKKDEQEKMASSGTQKTSGSEKENFNKNVTLNYEAQPALKIEGSDAKEGVQKSGKGVQALKADMEKENPTQGGESSKKVVSIMSKLETTQRDDGNLQPEISAASTNGVTCGTSSYPTHKADEEEKKCTQDVERSIKTALIGYKLEETQYEGVNVQSDIKLERTQEDIEEASSGGKLKNLKQEGRERLIVKLIQELDSIRSRKTQMSSDSQQEPSTKNEESSRKTEETGVGQSAAFDNSVVKGSTIQ